MILVECNHFRTCLHTINSFSQRLDAVEDLMSRHSLVSDAKEILRSLPDLERLLRK